MWDKTFHRIWFDEPERPEFAAWRDRLAELHPGWKIRTWGKSSEVRDMITDPALRAAWDRLITSDPFGRIPDIARYLILWKFGGVYIDTDFEPLRPMDDLLEDPRPFAGWENDRTMCTALLAAPREHPAIRVLLDGLVQRLAETETKTANEAVGPEYATAVWRERDDVRRLPPWAFYPVGWWERGLLGKVRYPEQTYAVHHWAKGWGTSKTAEAVGFDRTLSILVAFRDTDGTRTPLWDFLRARLETWDAEIIVASDDGEDPFHKTLALNRAARKATGEVLGIWDSDTWVQPEQVRKAMGQVGPDAWCRPWVQKLKMSEAATSFVLAQGEDWDGTINHRDFGRPEAQNNFQHSPPLLVTREGFDAVGGMDERIRGWGQEDTSFAMALNRIVGPMRSIRGQALHLYHPRLGRSGDDYWAGQDRDSRARNHEIGQSYRRARTRDAMLELIREREAVSV
jgi:hypothetical protein